MLADGWVTADDSEPRQRPPTRPPPIPPPVTSVPSIFSGTKMDYDTSHMWGSVPVLEEVISEEVVSEEKSIFSDTKVIDTYDIGVELGRGTTSIVYAGKNKETNVEVAIKVVTPQTNKLLRLPHWKSTDQTFTKIGEHPNIVKFIESFHESDDNHFIILESLPGSAVQILTKTGQKWTEKDACRVISKILTGIQFLHSKGIIHCDVTHGNILATDENFSNVKLGGFNKVIYEGDVINDLFCSQTYKAPEVLESKPFGKSIDIWAVGCLTFLFLSGKLPFKDPNIMKLNLSIRKGNFSFTEEHWAEVDDNAKDFVKSLLNIDPVERLTVDQALNHKWILSEGKDAVLKNFHKNLASLNK